MATRRPQKLTEEITRRIVNAILGGNYLETAAAYAGVDPKTVRRWLIQGSQKRADPLYRDLARRVTDALALAEVQAVAEIRAVGMGSVTETKNAEGAVVSRVARRQDWRALAWWLTHARRERWGGPDADADVYESPEWEEIKGRLFRCLAKVPGALEAIAAEFGESDPSKRPGDDPNLLEATSVRVQ